MSRVRAFWPGAVLVFGVGCLLACASSRMAVLQPRGYAQVADSMSAAPNRPGFSSLTILAPGNSQPTLRDVEAALVSSGVRVISSGAAGRVADAKASGAQAVLQLEQLDWSVDRRFFVLRDSAAPAFSPATEQQYKAAKPRFRWIVEGVVLRVAGKLIATDTGAIVDVLRLEYGSIPDATLQFKVGRGGIDPEQYRTGVSTYALPEHRRWVTEQIASALLRHVRGRG